MKVAVIGTGLMGGPMAERLREAGHEVLAYNRTAAKLAALREQGIRAAERPEEAVRGADGVILFLADDRAIRAVLSPPAVQEALRGRTVIQMGTIGPSESLALERELRGVGADYLEAPVLGSISEVRSGTLAVMVGGTDAQFARWSALFRDMSREPRLIGPVGTAAALKLALNQLIASETAAFALSLGLVRRRGIDPETFMELLRPSALYAPTFDKKLPRLRSREFSNPNFPTRHLLKDVALFLAEARAAGLATDSLAGMPALLRRAIDGGWGDVDYSSLYNAIDPPEPG